MVCKCSCGFYIIIRLILSLCPGCELRQISTFNAINVLDTGRTLCVQVLLQFYTVLMKHLHVLMAWAEHMYALRIQLSD